jgi:hypothetical protein
LVLLLLREAIAQTAARKTPNAFSERSGVAMDQAIFATCTTARKDRSVGKPRNLCQIFRKMIRPNNTEIISNASHPIG